ncbi:2-amino-4-hydroxy-6-hydroxymethyldihydropteridine diphosphokinase [Pseudaestuariivita atlantica]|uniref:2-amino-4-hydroxy-6-hydroxymethyldihydropteridine pyrophosphokinase n=1 Tax=Pseudaestuariivita atlantica TaxID=1317121 RepID=A0A0L1JSG9_9RHOB|nr:2-amino-4-hydroxy-6-hydroxymethyldihydropteridine diphosphokinase [Pseudaestuariivita atlantica]KNG94652.1 2-amino-4-hydroxy-6-hydroxymethyldihydropteridine pyrophosphokinase [Pseudaestuariivita atlantica]
MDQEFLIALGSNLPNGAENSVEICASALERLAGSGVRLTAISRFYRTPAFPAGAGPDYINATCSGMWSGDARSLLDVLHRIEADHDRERLARWGARTLDLDLLTLGHEVVPDSAVVGRWMQIPPAEQPNHTPDHLILPHPRLHERAFVVVPLMDIAADWRHPVLDITVSQMAGRLDPDDKSQVVPL